MDRKAELLIRYNATPTCLQDEIEQILKELAEAEKGDKGAGRLTCA